MELRYLIYKRLQRVLAILAMVCLIIFSSCSKKSEINILDAALASEHFAIKRVMDSLEGFELQIRYTQINRRNDSVLLTDFDFQVDENTYFYPASTVKFPAAVAALEKLNQLDSLHMNTRFYVEGDSVATTFARSIEEIFAVSDNEANNRLVEFLGFDELNEKIATKGVEPIRIAHRLSTADADNITTKPLVIYANDTTTVTSKPIINTAAASLELNSIQKGIGFYGGDSLYQEPFDFSLKNFFPINSQSGLLKRVIFPENFKEEERLDLSKEQHDFLLKSMAVLPYEAGYDRNEYYDGYVKFFMYGDTKKPMPSGIKIYNKVGYAYGTLTDCAYIIDKENEVEFMLVATILVNKDQIFNDDNYEYDDVGIPFLAQLGREIYQRELKR
ncbi:serine hydrolase [Croceivirga thetidis]|uniref:Serine hydrolase n=1 Tax=Croceivirga thetidis TaxID=2721623 RepID=A0ABX1GU66_9FLAO|nr:serine hydrolase [Croceivirga thetidis]NKI33497.1 serine hydrolase [Croceivirga thetidis]